MVGKKLKELLDAKKIKPGTLASMTGIPKETIYSIIRRNNKSMNLSTMEKIADALNVPIEYFHDREPKEDMKKDQPEPNEVELAEYIQLFKQMDDEQKQFILSAMKGILAKK